MIKNKIKYISCGLILSVLFSLSACDDYLDQKPLDGLVRSEYWNTKEEVLATLAGAYKMFTAMDYNLLVYGELRGDMLIPGVDLPGAQRNIMQSAIQSNNAFASWEGFYSVINFCNHVIDIAPSVQERDPTFSPFLMQQYVSEATFLRSLAYFYLVRIWNDVPLVLEPTETDNAQLFLPLTPANEVLERIKADLIDIRLQIPSVYPANEDTRSRATAGAVNALLTDICLWMFDYEESIQYADAVINSGNYFLLPSTEWFNIFQPGASLESIFELYFNEQIGQSNDLYVQTLVLDYFRASEYAQDILGVETTGAAEQVRGNGSLSSNNRIWKYGGFFPDRRTQRPINAQSSANFIIYRLADIYLMKAEALSQLERYDEALFYIQMIRERATVPPLNIPFTRQDFEQTILEERAKELAYEGKRWFDLMRMGRRNNFENRDKLIEILVANIPSTQRLVMQAKLSNPLGWFMPIHNREIENNRNITQNPYYHD